MISLLLITHGSLGEEMLNTAKYMLGELPLKTDFISILPSDKLDLRLRTAKARVKKLNEGDGVLVLTDIYGATPSNLAHKLRHYKNIAVISGLNLPMLVRILNYPNSSLEMMLQVALQGGRNGITLKTTLPELC